MESALTQSTSFGARAFCPSIRSLKLAHNPSPYSCLWFFTYLVVELYKISSLPINIWTVFSAAWSRCMSTCWRRCWWDSACTPYWACSCTARSLNWARWSTTTWFTFNTCKKMQDEKIPLPHHEITWLLVRGACYNPLVIFSPRFAILITVKCLCLSMRYVSQHLSAHVSHFLCCNCTKFNTTQDFQYKVFWRMYKQNKDFSFFFWIWIHSLRLQWEFTSIWQIEWVGKTIARKIVRMHIRFIGEVIVTIAMVATITP